MKLIKKIVSVALVLTLVLGIALTASSCGSQKKYTVGVCQLVQHVALDAATQGFIDTLKAEFGDDIEIINQNASGDASVCTTIATDFVNKNVDLILANATDALTACAGATTTIPVLGTSITEYGTALSIENFSGTVGGNVSGTSDLAPLDQQVECLMEVFPDTKTVALLYCSSEANSKYQVKVVREELEAKGVTCIEKSFSDVNDAMVVAAAAAKEADVIYIPTDNTAADAAAAIGGVIGTTPVFAGESGICSGCGVATLSIDYYDLGVATGKMAIKILKGEADISEMAIEYAAEFTKKYNAERCAQLGIDTANLEALGYIAIAD